MAKPRPNPPALHMLVALVVLLVPVLVIVGWFQRLPEPPVTPVDPAPVIARAASESPYPIAAPANLPQGWVATRARWTPKGEEGIDRQPVPGNTFQLGYLTPDRMYVALDQRDEQPVTFTAAVTREGRAEGAATVAGAEWARYVSADGRTRSLVRAAPDHVTIVSGDLPYGALEAFAGTLSEH